MDDNFRIVEKVLARGRWGLRILNRLTGRTKIISNARHVWLEGNPCFKEIPKGYVIHHLDHNELNDDISNLVLMQKSYHNAHHSKNKTVSTKINIDYSNGVRDKFYPVSEPKIYFNEQRNIYSIRFREEVNGVRSQKYISKFNGVKFTTKELAEEAKAKMWPVKGVC